MQGRFANGLKGLVVRMDFYVRFAIEPVVCMDTMYLSFPGSSTVSGSHPRNMSQGADHLPSAADVCFVLEGILVGSGREVLISVASTHALGLPSAGSSWLFLLQGACIKAYSSEVVVNST